MDELNRRAERAAAMLGVAFLTWLVNLMIWTRDVVLRRAAFGDADHALTDEQVINISALLRAQSIGWYGPILPVHAGVIPNSEEGQEDESDRLAS
jgi:hypothetical protein